MMCVMHHIPDPIFENQEHRFLLEGSLTLLAADPPENLEVNDPDVLRDAINAVLRNRPSVAQVSRVIVHTQEDDFDYESNTAKDICLILEAYREELYLAAS